MTTDCDLAHGLIVGGGGTRGNGYSYPFRLMTWRDVRMASPERGC